ncbi:hypothetical protein RP20_CCG002010 [Aedes albopictus]|nr:hypothetical protein RP20_CCG002010 [Aedes albopictus]
MTTNGGVPGAATDGPRTTIKKYGPGVTIKCCVQGCVSMYGDIGVSFHRFPTINTARDVLRRELWVEAAGLPNNNDIIDNSLICGRHFEMGKPSLPNEIRAANWTPSLNLKPKVETNFMMSAGETSNIAGIDTSTMMTTVSPKQREVVPILPIMGPQTVPKDLNLPQFCRLCLAEGVQMVFPKDSRVYDQLASKINDNLRLRITVIELTRSLICKNCYETLEQFHQFRTRCTRQDAYLHMRRSLEPERKQPLRYRDNWYWYSCLGNNMNSHKQKMEDVKTMYCNGEYVFDGYRYSFEMINLNRTLTFNCRSLKDPHGECTAVLITNDRSEVLTVGQHNHEREIIIESAVKDGTDGTKRSITLIRGFDREIVFCQGYWYTTVSEQQSSVSDWSCIREGCTSKIEMVNGTVQYYGTHCHLPVFLKWGAEEDKTIEPKTTTLMKVVNTLPPKPAISPIQQAIPPVALRQSTTIVHSRLPTATAPTSSLTGGIPASTIIKTEPSELQISSVSSCAPEPSWVARPQLNQPLVVSAATMASKATLPMATNKLPTVSVRSNHHIQVVRRTTAPTVRVVPHPRPVPPPTFNTSTIPTQVQTPSTSVAAPQPTVPKILHVMSLNLASKPEPTVLPEIPVSASDPPPSPNWTDLVPEIKEEPQDPLGEDEPETITDEIQPFSGETMAPPQPATVATNLPKPPPLTPRPMLLVSSASVTTCNTLDVTALDSECADSLRPKPPTENVSNPQHTLPPADEDDDGLHDLQDDDEIPPIVPIDADVVSRIIGSEYTTRRLPNGKTQVIRKNILSRGPSALVGTTAKRHVLPTAPPLPTRTGTKTTIRVYGPSPTAPKRVFSDSNEQNDLLTKKSKSTEVTDPPETAIVDVEKSATPEEDDQLDQTAAEDPIAVSIEPHQNLPDDEDSQQENEFSNDEATEAPSTPHENDEDPSPGEESSNDNEAIGESNSPHHNDETSPPQDKSSDDEAVKESNTPPVDAGDPEIQNVTTPNEQSEAEAPDQQNSQSDKKPSTSRSVQLVKLQRTEQMLSHEGHLYKLKWHNRKRHYWDCMLREQVNCMATLETVSENSQNWRKFLTHNHKVPKPIINEEYRNSYRMLTSETGVPKVKHLPVQTVNISDIKDQSGRMISMIRRKLCAFRIGRIAWGASLHFANYEYRITNAIFPGFR